MTMKVYIVMGIVWCGVLEVLSIYDSEDKALNEIVRLEHEKADYYDTYTYDEFEVK